MVTENAKRSCVLEPATCEIALFACLTWQSPLNLFGLESLILLCDATVLFDEIVYLDCTIPTFKHVDAPKSSEELAKDLLQQRLKWDFFDCNTKITDFPNSDWFLDLRKTRLEKEFDIKESGNVRTWNRIPHPVIGKIDWNRLMYLDKVSNAAATLGSTVIHPKDDATAILDKYQQVHPDISVAFLDNYNETLRKRFQDSKIFRYRELLHYAPIFFASAVAAAGTGKPEEVLNGIEQMRSDVTEEYRSLCNELIDSDESDQRNAVKIYSEIERLLGGLAQADDAVPSARGTVGRSVVGVFRAVAPLLKLAQGDIEEAGELVDSAGDLIDEGEKLKSTLDEATKHDLYRGLGFFNRLHASRPTSKTFYDDLVRVFGEVEFTHTELAEYLGGTQVATIYDKRKNS